MTDCFYGSVVFPGSCREDLATAGPMLPAPVPSSAYAGGMSVQNGLAPATDRQRHIYAPPQHIGPSYLHHDPQMRPCAAMSSSSRVAPSDHGYRSMSSPSTSSVSTMSPPVSYVSVFSPPDQLSHDCHGVPTHPSLSDFPPQSHNQYYNPYDGYLQHPPLAGLNNVLQQVQPLPAAHPPKHVQNYDNNNYYDNKHYTNNNINYINNNNNNNINNNHLFTDHYEFKELFHDKATTGKNSSRMSRNFAEKLRREKLNKCIQDLQTYVPLISNSSKKIEKTSVLRLSAAYLRLNRLLVGIKDQHEELPDYIKKANVADLMLDGDDIYLMVTSSGKIVFVSHSVENILGYSQNDLMGESFYKISNPNDHEELKKNLTYEYETPNSGTSIISGNDHLQNVKRYNRDNFKVQRRSFYLRLVKKASSRDEQPVFELVHVVGTLMIQNSGTKSSDFGENDIVLNAVVRPYNERCVTEVSMIESHTEEYITRHQIDGRIIYVDHRISIVSGFMPHEVCGQLAFQYMHIDDVRWVMIALRQMYYKGQSFGSSCYRLLSKNGEFVYMRTHGFLQLNTNDDTVESFICVNTLVPPEQGKRDIIEMKKRFTPLIIAASEPGIAAITYNQFMEKESTVTIEDITEDLKTLGKAVEQMITNIPEPAIDNIKVTAQNPGNLPDNQEYARVAALSKSIPPVTVSSNAPKFCKQSSLSPRPSYKPIVQDRPSVLVAPRISRQPVLVYNHQTDEKTEKDRAYLERRGDIFVMPKRQNYSKSVQDNLPKKAKIVSESQKTLDNNDSLFMGPDSYDSYVPGVYDQGSSTDIIQDPLIQVLQHSKSFGSALLEEKQNTLKNKMDQQQGQLKEIQTELNLLSSNANTHFLAKDYSNLKAVIDHQQQALRELQEVHQNIGV